MEQRLSLLVFSIENYRETAELVDLYYGYVDDIVIVDSSNAENHQQLIWYIKDKAKVQLFRTPALGYPEPFRNFGIKKCKGDWIILLDVDERLSDDLKNSLRALMEIKGELIYKVKRYEDCTKNSINLNFYTWQIRLFKKGSTIYKGLTHETPKMKGDCSKIYNKPIYIKHLNELKHEREYNKMDLFTDTPAFILTARDSFIGNKIGKVKNIKDIKKIYKHHEAIKAKQTREIREIGEIIRNRGIIDYLNLTNDETIAKLNEKYDNEKQGIDLLITLLADKYKGDQI
jgi:glycosyltransferase involved in cell wall biosynthesis